VWTGTCTKTFTGPRNLAELVRTTTVAADLLMRMTCRAVNVIEPVASVEQRPQSTCLTTAELRPESMRNEALTGPSSAGRLSFQVSRHAFPRGWATFPADVRPPSLLTRAPWNRPAAFVPATGARRARTCSHDNGCTTADAVPHATAATTSPTTIALDPALRVLITSEPPDLGGIGWGIVVEIGGLGSARSK
jgi:hypothetical protein